LVSAEGVEKAEAVLKDVLELQGALDLAPTARDICLDPWVRRMPKKRC